MTRWLAIVVFLIRDRAVEAAQDAPVGSRRRHLWTQLAIRLPE